MPSDYKQYNYSATYSGGSFAGNACGPTACADLLDKSPLLMAQWLTNNGYATNGQGTVWSGISACLKAYGGGGVMLAQGLDGVKSSNYFTQWQQHIQKGYCGILLMHKVYSNYWTNGGHYIAIVGYKDGKYLVYDPASASRTGYHSWGDFAGNICCLYTSTIRWGSSTPATSNVAYSFSPKKVMKGDNSKSTLLLQEILCSRGFYNRKLGLDGSFGDGTYKAVVEYQKTRSEVRLEVDGICGPATWTDLLGKNSTKVSLKQISTGSSGLDVLLLQEILSAKGLYAGALDRSFGPGTAAGVRAFQKSAGIAVDGICGPATWKKLIQI